jgi:hypothetical protein
MRYLFLFLLVILTSTLSAQKISDKPIPVAHAHNDYNKSDALWGALEYGFTSIEIDVFAHKNELKVAHVGLFLNARKNIVDMYFEPLAILLKTRTWIYENYQEPLELMIDFKTNSATTLPLLLEVIEPYKDLFTYYQNGEVYKKPLMLVISGRGFSFDDVKDMDKIYVFSDGSVNSCSQTFPKELVPRGSANYNSQFSWSGKGKMSTEELKKLNEQISEAKKCNKKIRYYGMKNSETLWFAMLEKGAGWINIDKKKKFAKFYWDYISAKAEPIN